MTHEPPRVDYVLLTVTPEERDATQAVFGHMKDVTGPLPYAWVEVEHITRSRNLIVAHVSLNDDQGGLPSSNVTSEIIEYISPTHILVIGIAGGISTKKDPTPLASVVIPNIVHTGPFKSTGPRENPTIPPSPQLYKSIWPIAEKLDWLEYIGMDRPDGSEDRPIIRNGELVSSNSNLSGISDAVLRKILRGYPRVRAVEMEIGGVAFTLGSERFLREQNRPTYLAIKSISDVVYDSEAGKDAKKAADEWLKKHCSTQEFDDDTRNALRQDLIIGFSKPSPEEVDLNEDQRATWRGYAARVSAALAKRFIEVNPIPKRPIQYRRMWSNTVTEGVGFFADSVGILTRVSTKSYSKLAKYLLTRYQNNLDDDLHFFTVCAFSPKRLYEYASYLYTKEFHRPAAHFRNIVDFARSEFVHFEAFSEHAARNPGRCVRILLVDEEEYGDLPLNDSEAAAKRRREISLHNRFFRALNGQVPCWSLNRPRARHGNEFLTDYVIIGGEVLLDYYEDSGIMHVGDLTDWEVSDYFIELFKEFKRKHGGGGTPARSKFKLILNKPAWYAAFSRQAEQAA